MSLNTKEDASHIDTSASSLSTDMSLLDELFPSLGNGESSANHFTNQLAVLLNNLGSSDDEGSNGPNLFNPLQLSPPRLNEFHALATANLISQTQEAIMQEYNIPDFAFEQISQSDTIKHDELRNNDNNVQSTSEAVSYNNQMHKLGANTVQDISFLKKSAASTAYADSDKTSKYLEEDKPNVSNNKDFEHITVNHTETCSKDLDIDETSLTKVKLKTSRNENEGINRFKKDTHVYSDQQNQQQYGNQLTLNPDFETQTAVSNILDTQSVIQNQNVIHSVSTNCAATHRSDRNYSSNYHSTIDIQCDNRSVLKHSLDDNSDAYSPSKAVCNLPNPVRKSNQNALDYVLPPKKRHLECNKVTMAFTKDKSNIEFYSKSGHCDSLQNVTETRSIANIPKGRNTKENEKAKSIVFICVICTKQFSNIDDLELHSSCHLQYSCPFPGCVRTFTYRSHLSYHKQSHEGQKNYQCTECGKEFRKAQHLDVHMMSHKESKPFTCSVCNKSFTTSGNLKSHSRTHSGERPYVCDFNGCSKAFAELSSLKKHKVIHTGEKSFRCDVCGKSFTQASSRTYHMKKHKEKT